MQERHHNKTRTGFIARKIGPCVYDYQPAVALVLFCFVFSVFCGNPIRVSTSGLSTVSLRNLNKLHSDLKLNKIRKQCTVLQWIHYTFCLQIYTKQMIFGNISTCLKCVNWLVFRSELSVQIFQSKWIVVAQDKKWFPFSPSINPPVEMKV